MSTTWELHPTEPDTWQVVAPWGQCIAAIRPQDGTNFWEGAIRPRDEHRYPGVKITCCPSREAGIGLIAKLLATHWPEVTA